MRVLVAEDDRVTRIRILSYLKKWGHEAIEAANGKEAWQRFCKGGIDMVLTDWQMPEMDGIELLRRIRTATENADYLYAILLTSRSEKCDVIEGMEAGADDFVAKPFDKDELRVRINAGKRIIELEHALAAQNRQLADANRGLMAANTRMKESLMAAAKIQQSFLPEHPPESGFARFAWLYEPCDELAGDTLNIIALDDNHVGIYVIDVSGHGVPAALLSVHLSRILTRLNGAASLVRKWQEEEKSFEVTTPSQVTSDLNRRFIFNEETQQYFTSVYGVLDQDHKFCFTSAGHPGPLVISGGRGKLHQAKPPAVGFFADGQFSEETLQCKPGDRLYFYSDGIFEIANRNGEELGQERLKEILVGAADQPLEESLEAVRKAAIEWLDGEGFDDDVSLIAVEML